MESLLSARCCYQPLSPSIRARNTSPRLNTMGASLWWTALLVALSGAVVCGHVVDEAQYAGCFDPGYAIRQNYHHHTPYLTLEKCVNICAGKGNKYVGVEKSDNFCYCGDDMVEESVKRNDSLCEVRCPDPWANRTCGGEWLISVYKLPVAAPSDDTSGVGFLVGLSTGIRQYNSSSQSGGYANIMSTTEWAYTVDYHYAKNMAFTFSRGKLHKASLQPKENSVAALPTAIGTTNSNCDGFAVDWEHDCIYWAECVSTQVLIVSMDLSGRNMSTVIKRPEESSSIKRMEIDPYARVLFWTADGVIESCGLSGENYRTNLSSPEYNVRSLALDTEARRVYYVGTANQSILFSMDYDGGEVKQHFSASQLRSVYGLGVFHGYVYWVHYAGSRDVIYRARLDLGSRSFKLLETVDRAVWHMRLIHPDLQRPPSRDPCAHQGCSHRCDTHLGSAPTCSCPDDMLLDSDHLTCVAPHLSRLVEGSTAMEQQSRVSVVLVVGCLLMVVAIVVLSAALTYLADRYWPYVSSKLFSVPYSRQRPGQTEDSVTLVYEPTVERVNHV